MLPMPTLKLRHPVTLIILMEANNAPFHTGRFPRLSNGWQISCEQEIPASAQSNVPPQANKVFVFRDDDKSPARACAQVA
jgi:hypothetical protein